MANELLLDSGLTLIVRELRQRTTYEGMLEGLPTSARNRALIDDLMHAPENQSYGVPPYLIEPGETPIPGAVGRFPMPMALPDVICVGRYELSAMHCDDLDCTGLTIIWFQDEFAFPIAPEVMAALRKLDWYAHAGPFQF